MGLTAEELAMLTEEERAGYEEDDEEGEGGEGNEGDDGAGDDGNDDGAGEGDDGAEGGEGNPNTDDGAGSEPEKVTPEPVPLFKAELPADIEAKRQGLDTREDELVQKFDEGDITFAEYNKEMRALNRERSDIDRAELKADLAREAQQSQVDGLWQNTANSFVNAHPLINKNETTWNSFDAVLRRVTSETMAKGQQPGQRELDKAYQQWTADLGITDTGTKTTTKQKQANLVPPTLGKVPASTATDTDDGKWATLDRLADSDPLAYEAAMMRLSDSERDEYTRAG